jgi:hypothetical protein
MLDAEDSSVLQIEVLIPPGFGEEFILLWGKNEALLVCPNYSGTSVHERPCSRTIRFTNKFSEQTTSRITNTQADNTVRPPGYTGIKMCLW